MNERKPRFFKGLPGYIRQDDETLARDVEGGVYYWWWEYLRLSPAFWFARETGRPLIDPKMAQTYELAGNLMNKSFKKLWFVFFHRFQKKRILVVFVCNKK